MIDLHETQRHLDNLHSTVKLVLAINRQRGPKMAIAELERMVAAVEVLHEAKGI